MQGVNISPLFDDTETALLIEPAGVDDLAAWIASARDEIDAKLLRAGALLFRGFDVPHASAFAEVASAIDPALLDYRYRSTPRTSVSTGVYTASEYPAELTIGQHNENAYQRTWPLKLIFFCEEPAARGGETPLADQRKVTASLDQEVRDRFDTTGVMYVRNYRVGLDLPWQEVFQTDSKEEVDRFCEENDIQTEWRDGDELRTRQVCQAHAEHPRTGERLWFNAAHMFHVSNLDEATREALLTMYEEDELPRNVLFGDGSTIDVALIDRIRDAFLQHRHQFPWRRGDVLLIDNMLVSHGRMPYAGPRRVLTAFAQPCSADG